MPLTNFGQFLFDTTEARNKSLRKNIKILETYNKLWLNKKHNLQYFAICCSLIYDYIGIWSTFQTTAGYIFGHFKNYLEIIFLPAHFMCFITPLQNSTTFSYYWVSLNGLLVIN